jgi:hypothetical protein
MSNHATPKSLPVGKVRAEPNWKIDSDLAETLIARPTQKPSPSTSQNLEDFTTTATSRAKKLFPSQ